MKLQVLFFDLGRYDHEHVAPVNPGLGFNHGDIGQFGGEAVDNRTAEIHVSYFATAENQRNFGLVALLKETPDVLDLEHQVMIIGLGTELDLLDLHMNLLFAGLLLFLALLVLELSIIHDPADWRNSCRRHLDQVELLLLGKLHGLRYGDDTQRLTIGTDDPDLGSPDGIVDVDGRLRYDCTSWIT